MYRTVIVPLNGSALAEHAVGAAIEEADRHGARLVFIRVVPRPELTDRAVHRSGPAPVLPHWPEAELAAEETAARRYLERVAWHFRVAVRPDGIDLVVPVGEPFTRLLAEVRRRPAPLVVVGVDRLVPEANETARRLLLTGAAPIMAVVHPPAAATQPVSSPGPVEAPLPIPAPPTLPDADLAMGAA